MHHHSLSPYMVHWKVSHYDFHNTYEQKASIQVANATANGIIVSAS